MPSGKQCAICQNAYGTRFICKKCREPEVVEYRDKDGKTQTWVGPPRAEGWSETSGNKGDGDEPAREVAVAEYRETDVPAVFSGVFRDEFTPNERLVAGGIWLGKTDAQIARETGLTRGEVKRIRSMFFET